LFFLNEPLFPFGRFVTPLTSLDQPSANTLRRIGLFTKICSFFPHIRPPRYVPVPPLVSPRLAPMLLAFLIRGTTITFIASSSDLTPLCHDHLLPSDSQLFIVHVIFLPTPPMDPHPLSFLQAALVTLELSIERTSV